MPVISQERKPLMPTTFGRAMRWAKSGKATPFYSKGVFCVRLNIEPSDDKKQEIAVGIDPGSKREAISLKSASHTYINILLNAVDWVKFVVEVRREARRARRFRKMRSRETRFNNRKKSKIAPSTKARWDNKLRIVRWLGKLFPIIYYCVEDIKAKTKGKKKWDESFSPLEIGKKYFYNEMEKLGNLSTKLGYETKELRDRLGLKKSNKKLDDKFECHNVDSWVLANSVVGGHEKPDNISLVKLVPLRFHRRQLHVLQFSKGGKRKHYGGTMSLGFKRGSIVKHKKHGVTYVGGTMNGRISLHSPETGKRLSQQAKTEDCKFLGYNSYRKEHIVLLTTGA